MRKCLIIAPLLLLTAVAAYALVFYPAGDSYADGSWRSYSVYPYQDGGPPDAPCRGRITYGPEWCTSAANCQAKAAAPPSIPKCAIPPDDPIDP